ncbi:MAG TPA: hypothetical protein VGE59_05015 [Patescibacteria group bacterium]
MVFKYGAIGLVLGVSTVFLSVIIVDALLGGVVDTTLAAASSLNLWSALGIIVLYTLLAIGVGEILDSAHRDTKSKK